MRDREDKNLFESVFEEFKEDSNHTEGFDPLSESYLTEEIDHEILKHRDAHFAGDFKVMHNYYQQETTRQHPDIDLERIEYLAQIEAELNQNLAETFLTEHEMHEVEASLNAYETLKELYLKEEKTDLLARLIADLILAEDEEAEEEIEQIVLQGKKIVPALIKIIKTREAYDPLFPGYGFAPYLATICLGKIKDPSAIIPLFEQLNQEALFDEQAALTALQNIGEPAKKYLLGVINSRPVTKDNINAAYALTLFSDDIEVGRAAFENLKDSVTQENTLFATYLICNLETLKNSNVKEELLAWCKTASLSNSLKRELEEIVAHWH